MKLLKLNRKNLVKFSQDTIDWWLSWSGIINSTRPLHCDDLIKRAQMCRLLETYPRWNSRDLYSYFTSIVVLESAYCRWFGIPVITSKDVFELPSKK